MEKAELINQTMALSKRLGKMQSHYAFESWRKLDVPLAQLKSLFLINSRGKMSVSDLARDLGVTPGNVTSIIDRLVGQGLVKRSENPEDRRLVLLELTDKGRKTISDIQDTGMSHMKNILERMSKDDIAALHRGLSSFLTIVEEDYKKLKPDRSKTGRCACQSTKPSRVAGEMRDSACP